MRDGTDGVGLRRGKRRQAKIRVEGAWDGDADRLPKQAEAQLLCAVDRPLGPYVDDHERR